MKEYQVIEMISDKYSSDGIEKGAIGCIVNIYNERFCEVEFSLPNGETYALQAICVDDFVVIGE